MSYYYGLLPSEKWEEGKRKDSIRTGMGIGVISGAVVCFFFGIEIMIGGAFIGMLIGAYVAHKMIYRKERKKDV